MSLPLLGGEEITYSEARKQEENILLKLDWPSRRREFRVHIHQNRGMVRALVAHHLGLKPDQCRTTHPRSWFNGSFNQCVPIVVTVENHTRYVLMRFPLPYRVGDADEKVRCEAGTYSWLEQECPTIPIPRLYGFGLSTGQHFTTLGNMPLHRRVLHYIRRWFLSFFTTSRWSNLLPHPNTTITGPNLGPYLLLDFITDGEMLSNTWEERRSDTQLRDNLFRGLSRILISMTRVPQPRIGSFTIDHDGRLQLANRPLTMMLVELEHQAIPVPIKKDQIFSSSHSYVDALLACHDSRLQNQPNAVTGLGDCMEQMSTTMLMRCVAPHHFDPNHNHGPFAFFLTDCHTSNILVDSDWNIKCLLDLEFGAALPTEWASQFPVFEEDEDDFRREFWTALECEANRPPVASTTAGNQDTSSSVFWYVLALTSPWRTFNIFQDKIKPLFVRPKSEQFNYDLAMFWKRDALDFVRAKAQEKEMFDTQLRKRFGLES